MDKLILYAEHSAYPDVSDPNSREKMWFQSTGSAFL